ncbi:cell surface glycoprotein MUC18 [Carassius gibelio]|uniref:cell surface glycoprotein MUC18 n=1 Tax=Carassius gibelio TaxID=101364 RepID=UPI0022775798|nr:cell surface glycoprotein MUC18 [Carassius gibelio]
MHCSIDLNFPFTIMLFKGNPVFRTVDKQQGGSSAVVIAVVVCVLLLVVLVAMLYFLSNAKKLSCGKKNKNNGASGDNKDNKLSVRVSEEFAPLNTEQC